MSNSSNDNLLQRAADMINYWEGTPISRRLEHYVDENDLQELEQAVTVAEGMAAQEEIFGANI